MSKVDPMGVLRRAFPGRPTVKPKEAADTLGVSKATVHRMIDDGSLSGGKARGASFIDLTQPEKAD